MRSLPLFLLTLLTAQADDVTAQADDVLLHRIRMHSPSAPEGYRKIEFRVGEAALKAFGKWEPDEGKPAAVSRNEAVKLALKSAGIEPGTPGGATLVSLEKVNDYEVGKKTLPAGCSPWFYVIELQNASPAPEGRFFVVTVGGTLAKAVVAD
jgi:hypothetical protein